MSGSRHWIEGRVVRDTGEANEIIGVNGNALVVPRRAFTDAPSRAAFLQAASSRHAAATA